MSIYRNLSAHNKGTYLITCFLINHLTRTSAACPQNVLVGIKHHVPGILAHRIFLHKRKSSKKIFSMPPGPGLSNKRLDCGSFLTQSNLIRSLIFLFVCLKSNFPKVHVHQFHRWIKNVTFFVNDLLCSIKFSLVFLIIINNRLKITFGKP